MAWKRNSGEPTYEFPSTTNLFNRINYDSKTVFVRFIGTHKAYDAIDAEVI